MVDSVVVVLLVLNTTKQALDNVMLFVVACVVAVVVLDLDELALFVDNMFEQVVDAVAAAAVFETAAVEQQAVVGVVAERLLFELSSEPKNIYMFLINVIIN